MVPAVTELIVAELMYLEKNGQGSAIEMLINSSGTTRQDGEIVSLGRALLAPACCPCPTAQPGLGLQNAAALRPLAPHSRLPGASGAARGASWP